MLDKSFKWRERGGNLHSVQDMETRHLFYTLRMIWNNSMPQDAVIKGCNVYAFDKFYTADYMKQAVRLIMVELSKRTLTKYQADTIDFMRNYFTKKLSVKSPNVTLEQPQQGGESE